MAEKKNFTIENYNGTDYDTLYPETNSGQVKLDLASQSELNLFGGGLDDALAKLNNFDNRYEIGDTIVTTRTNLGNKWLLCNGATVNSNDYPELAQYFNATILQFSKFDDYTISPYESDVPYVETAARPIPLTNTDGMLFYCMYKTSSSGWAYIFSYKRLGSSGEEWVNLKGSTVNNYLTKWSVVDCLNDAFILFTKYTTNTSYPATISEYPLLYCTNTPTSHTSFLQAVKPSIGLDGAWVAGKYLNGKYFMISYSKDSKSLYSHCYTSFDSAPISTLIASNMSAHGTVLGVVDNKISINIGSDTNTAIFALINADNTIENVTVNTTDGRNLSGAELRSLGDKYVLNHTYSPTEFVYASNDLSNTFSLIAKSTTWDIVVQKDNMLIISNGSYVNSDLTFGTFDTTPSGLGGILSLVSTKNYDYATTGNVGFWRSSNQQQFTLPTSSPGDGMYRYIKALN